LATATENAHPLPTNRPSAKSAETFLARLIDKLEKLEAAISEQQYGDAEVVRAQIAVYARHVRDRCGAFMGETLADIEAALAKITDAGEYASVENDAARNGMLSRVRDLRGTLTAIQEFVSENSSKSMRTLISAAIAVVGIAPALLAPELATLGLAAVLGYFGISGTAAKVVMGIFRRKSGKTGDAVPDDADVA
jgi:hypothetical protein